MKQNSTQHHQDLALAKEWQQEKRSLAAAKKLFFELNATEVLEELDLLFKGYLVSHFADDLHQRSFRVGTYFSLRNYFLELESLQITKPRTYVKF